MSKFDIAWRSVKSTDRVGASAMPRYFFDIEDGRALPDPIGSELADVAEALRHAERLLAELLAEGLAGAAPGAPLRVAVTDDWGLVLFRLCLVLDEAPSVSARRARAEDLSED